LLTLLQRGAAPPPVPPPQPPPRNYAAQGFPPTGYAQSPYSQPPASAANPGPAKGGFGTSAPPRADSTPSTSSPASPEGGSV
jgi:hypothetical protein